MNPIIGILLSDSGCIFDLLDPNNPEIADPIEANTPGPADFLLFVCLLSSND